LRIDPSTSTLEGLADSLTKAGKRGVYRFSSEDAARTLAVVARERSSSIASIAAAQPVAGGINFGDCVIRKPAKF
jgi:hypothetical protein